MLADSEYGWGEPVVFDGGGAHAELDETGILAKAAFSEAVSVGLESRHPEVRERLRPL